MVTKKETRPREQGYMLTGSNLKIFNKLVII